jgi:hypothetical protein
MSPSNLNTIGQTQPVAYSVLTPAACTASFKVFADAYPTVDQTITLYTSPATFGGVNFQATAATCTISPSVSSCSSPTTSVAADTLVTLYATWTGNQSTSGRMVIGVTCQ